MVNKELACQQVSTCKHWVCPTTKSWVILSYDTTFKRVDLGGPNALRIILIRSSVQKLWPIMSHFFTENIFCQFFGLLGLYE